MKLYFWTLKCFLHKTLTFRDRIDVFFYSVRFLQFLYLVLKRSWIYFTHNPAHSFRRHAMITVNLNVILFSPLSGNSTTCVSRRVLRTKAGGLIWQRWFWGTRIPLYSLHMQSQSDDEKSINQSRLRYGVRAWIIWSGSALCVEADTSFPSHFQYALFSHCYWHAFMLHLCL